MPIITYLGRSQIGETSEINHLIKIATLKLKAYVYIIHCHLLKLGYSSIERVYLFLVVTKKVKKDKVNFHYDKIDRYFDFKKKKSGS